MHNIFIPKSIIKISLKSEYLNADNFYNYYKEDPKAFLRAIDKIIEISTKKEYAKYQKNSATSFNIYVVRLYSLIGYNIKGKKKTIQFYNVGEFPLKIGQDYSFIETSFDGSCRSVNLLKFDDPYIPEILKMKNFRYRKLDLLGHYTKRETAIEYILPSKRLLINNLWLSNDPVESKKYIGEFIDTKITTFNDIIKDNHQQFESTKFYQNFIRYISFVKNKKGQKVFEVPNMWAYYGQRYEGVCLVFDKKLLKSLFKNQYSQKVKDLTIKYNLDRSESGKIKKKNHESLEEFFSMNAKDILFRKHKVWAEESEYRFAVIDENCDNERWFLEKIDKALLAVVIGIEFNENYLCSILKLIERTHIRAYKLSYKKNKFEVEPLNHTENIFEYDLIEKL